MNINFFTAAYYDGDLQKAVQSVGFTFTTKRPITKNTVQCYLAAAIVCVLFVLSIMFVKG